MTKLIACLILCLTVDLHGMNEIDAVAAVENGPTGFHYLSKWNISKPAWQDVKEHYPKADIGRTWPDVGRNETLARECARLYLELCCKRMVDAGVNCGVKERYACFLLGFHRFKTEYDCDLKKCPPNVQDAADRVYNLVGR